MSSHATHRVAACACAGRRLSVLIDIRGTIGGAFFNSHFAQTNYKRHVSDIRLIQMALDNDFCLLTATAPVNGHD